jgi:hypothetical protein
VEQRRHGHQTPPARKEDGEVLARRPQFFVDRALNLPVPPLAGRVSMAGQGVAVNPLVPVINLEHQLTGEFLPDEHAERSKPRAGAKGSSGIEPPRLFRDSNAGRRERDSGD